MALTTTNAQISIQDGALPAVNLTSGTSVGLFTPGALVTFALQSTAGIQTATYQLVCPKYPGLHNLSFDWHAGMVNQWQVTMPANIDVANIGSSAGILVICTASDGSSSIATSFNYLQSKGAAGASLQFLADYVIVSALPAYTNVGGVLTGNANGAITSTMTDGATPAVGDTFLLPNGIATGGTDPGLYTIVTLGSGSAKFVAVQAPAWQAGVVIPQKTEILIDKGLVYSQSTWVNTLAGNTNAIGASGFTFYPRSVVQSVTLTASGNIVISNVPILSATKTLVIAERTATGGTVTSTVMYNTAAAPTAGQFGTGTVTVQASVAAGTANTADQSVLTVGIFNQV